MFIQTAVCRKYIEVPVNKLHSTSMLSYEQLTLVETLAIGVHAIDRAQITSEDTVLIIGAGTI